jgi:hypothetical protein
MRNSYNILGGIYERKRPHEGLELDGSIILK